jgi:hypothetical protein
MKHLLNRSFCLLLIGILTVASISHAEEQAEKTVKKKPMVQIAILLDNSGSMQGLINQARAELWKVVNEFVTARLDGQHPDLQVAVYHYGNPPATQLVALTDDLDRVSEALFGIPVSGGSEYCGQVIQLATQQLKWSDSHRDLKLIFIAGNEPFTQGPVDYRQACKAAIAKGITINTIHCGKGIPTGWLDGALLTDGKSMNINHTAAVVHVAAPQDKEISKLGIELNKTYIAFGKKGAAGLRRQSLQDKNAGNSSIATAQQRAVTKANAFYRNSTWDLCDAWKEGKVDLAKIKTEDLPEIMRKMTLKQRTAYVKTKQAERLSVQKKINELNAVRLKYVATKQKELAEKTGQETLDTALISAIREQATKKKFSFEKE